MTVWVRCADGGNGEWINLTGELHEMHTCTLDGACGMYVKMHFQPQQIKRVGLTTGDKYQGKVVTQEQYDIRPDGFLCADTFVSNFHNIGQGKGNSHLLQDVWHATINANGEATAEVDNHSIECK